MFLLVVKTWVPFIQGSYVPSFVEADPLFLEKMNIEKVYKDRLTDGQTDDGRQVIGKAHELSFCHENNKADVYILCICDCDWKHVKWETMEVYLFQ